MGTADYSVALANGVVDELSMADVWYERGDVAGA